VNELETEIRHRLSILEPLRMELVDQSSAHAGHRGSSGGGHFFLTIVSNQFSGLSAVARHRAVYQALGDLMAGRIHALSINALAPDES